MPSLPFPNNETHCFNTQSCKVVEKMITRKRARDVSQRALKIQKFSDVSEDHYLLKTLFLMNAINRSVK